jgi:hypothetical protein
MTSEGCNKLRKVVWVTVISAALQLIVREKLIQLPSQTPSITIQSRDNTNIHARDEKSKVTLRTRPSNLIQWENITDRVKKIKFILNNTPRSFNRVCKDYTRSKNFILVDQYDCFPREDYNCSSISTEFHTVRIAPTSYRICIRMQKITIFRRVNGTVYFIYSNNNNLLIYVLNSTLRGPITKSA